MLVFLCLTRALCTLDSPSSLVAGRGVMPPSFWLSDTALQVYPPVHPSPVLTHLGFSHVLVLVHGAAVNIGVHLSFKTMGFSGSEPSNGIAGP